MAFQSWLMYLALVTVATSTPGPAVLFIMTNSTLYGWKKAVFAALGNIAGLFCLGVIAVTGLGTILKTSALIFGCVKLAGAAYLCYLGLKMIFQKGPAFSGLEKPCEFTHASSWKIFSQALGVAMSNPKAIVFLTALFPQFVDVNHSLVPQFSMLIAVLMTFSFFFLMGYAILAHKARAWITTPGRVKAFNRASGSVFIGFGALLAMSSGIPGTGR